MHQVGMVVISVGLLCAPAHGLQLAHAAPTPAADVATIGPVGDPVTATPARPGGEVETSGAAGVTNAELIVPAGTTVMLQLDAAVSSRTAVRGDMFPISLAEPVSLGGAEVIPAGIAGEGQVVHAAGTGLGGRAGELIVAARYLMWGERRIPLRGMRISMAGRNNTAEALAASQIIPLAGLFVTGTSVDLPVGQVAIARFAEDVPIARTANDATAASGDDASDHGGGTDLVPPAAAEPAVANFLQPGG